MSWAVFLTLTLTLTLTLFVLLRDELCCVIFVLRWLPFFKLFCVVLYCVVLSCLVLCYALLSCVLQCCLFCILSCVILCVLSSCLLLSSIVVLMLYSLLAFIQPYDLLHHESVYRSIVPSMSSPTGADIKKVLTKIKGRTGLRSEQLLSSPFLLLSTTLVLLHLYSCVCGCRCGCVVVAEVVVLC